MKKLLLILFIAQSLSSCKKDFVCECYIYAVVGVENVPLENMTKKEAKKECASYSKEDFAECKLR